MYSIHTLKLAKEACVCQFFQSFFGIHIGIPEGKKQISFLVRCGQVGIGRTQIGH